MSPIPSLPSRDDVLRMARSTTDITGQLLDTAGNITRIAVNTLDPRDGSGAEALRVLRETTAGLAGPVPLHRRRRRSTGSSTR